MIWRYEGLWKHILPRLYDRAESGNIRIFRLGFAAALGCISATAIARASFLFSAMAFGRNDAHRRYAKAYAEQYRYKFHKSHYVSQRQNEYHSFAY